MNPNVLARYAPAITQLAITLIGALVVLRGPLTLAAALQLVPLAANVVLVYFVPLFGVNARSGWKTGVAVAVAIAAAAIPFATVGHITGGQALVVIFAGLQALGAHIGVQIRNGAASAVETVFIGASPTAPVTAAAGAEPPTDTTITKAITSNGGEFLGDAAR
jgi:hypothetical protein